MVTAVIAAAAFISANAAYISIAISIASVGYSLYAAKKAREQGQTQSERKQVLRSGSAPKTWLYGDNESAGLLVFGEEQPGAQDEDEMLHLVMTLSGSEIDHVGEVYFNDEPATNFSRYTTIQHYPQGRTTVDPYLKSNTRSWKDDMIGKDFAWFRISLKFNADAFPTGVPNVTAHKFGRRIYDPRTGRTEYSNNPALAILDYLKNHPSLQYQDDELIMPLFIAAANICDETVNVYNADDNVTGTEKRYTLSAEFDINEEPSSVLDKMFAACGGEPIKVGGMFGIHVGAYYGPTTYELDEDDVIAPIAIQPEAAREESYNVVRGIYNSKENRFQDTDYPEVRFDNWITEDGEEIIENLDLQFVNSPSQCQRIAALQAARARFGMFMEIPCNLRGTNYPPGTSFHLTLASMELKRIELKVLAWRFNMQEGVTLVCRRESPQYYDNQNGHAIVLPPILNLPTGGVPAPTNVRYTTELVGEVIQGVISWTNPSFKSSRTEVLIKDSNGDLIQSSVVPFPGTSANVNGKLVGTYTAELRAVSLTGALSAVAGVSFTVAAPSAPNSVSIKPSNWSIQLVPVYSGKSIPINTLFEFWHVEDTASVTIGQPSFGSGDRARASLVFTGSTFNQGGLTPDRYQHYWIRAVNAYGSSPFVYKRTATTKNQELVTTVVERLQAIEVQSANWKPGSNGMSANGYKLFSPTSGRVTLPDGTVLTNPDGLAVFNNVVARGDIFARSLTFISGATIPPEIDNNKVISTRTYMQANAPTGTIPNGSIWYHTDDNNKPYRWNGSHWIIVRDEGIISAGKAAGSIYPSQSNLQIKSGNYVQGSKGWAIDADGNAEFNNATVRGRFYAGDIIGDIYEAVSIEMDSEWKLFGIPPGQDRLWKTITIPKAEFPRKLHIPSIWQGLQAQVIRIHLNNTFVKAMTYMPIGHQPFSGGGTEVNSISTSSTIDLPASATDHEIKLYVRGITGFSAQTLIVRKQDFIISYWKTT